MSFDHRPMALSLAVAGLDITQSLNTEWYNTHIAANGLPLSPLPSFGRPGGALCLLIGNTRDLWPIFLRWLRDQPDPSMDDPIDTYVTSTINALLTSHLLHGYDVFWPGDGGERLVSMQRVALTSGLCAHDPGTQLAIHPTYGAWVAFRAVVCIACDPQISSPPAMLPDPLSAAEKAAAQEVSLPHGSHTCAYRRCKSRHLRPFCPWRRRLWRRPSERPTQVDCASSYMGQRGWRLMCASHGLHCVTASSWDASTATPRRSSFTTTQRISPCWPRLWTSHGRKVLSIRMTRRRTIARGTDLESDGLGDAAAAAAPRVYSLVFNPPNPSLACHLNVC